MEHRQFIQSLTREQRQLLSSRNDQSAIVRLSVLAICMLTSSVAIIQGWSLWPIWMLVQGLLLISLFHLLHECVHDTVFIRRWPNRLLAHLCGFVLFLPATWFRYFHHAHHRYTNLPGKDPELDSEKPANILQWLLHVSGITIWRSQLSLLLNALLRPCNEPYIRAKERKIVRFEMLVLIALYFVLLVVSAITMNPILIELWLLPLLMGQPFLRLYLLAEHADCEQSPNMLSNTRTVLTNPFVRWFTWNMPYHTEHHVFPTVPFHRLPQLHALLKNHLVEVDSSYSAFNTRYVRQLSK